MATYRGPRVRREAYGSNPFATLVSSGFQAFDEQEERERRRRAEGRDDQRHSADMRAALQQSAGMGERLESAGVREGERPGMVVGADMASAGITAGNFARFRDLPGVEGFYLDRHETPEFKSEQSALEAANQSEAANRALYEGAPAEVRDFLGGYSPGMDVQKAIQDAWGNKLRAGEEAGRTTRHGQSEARMRAAGESGEGAIGPAGLTRAKALSEAREILKNHTQPIHPGVVQGLADALFDGRDVESAISQILVPDPLAPVSEEGGIGMAPQWQRRRDGAISPGDPDFQEAMPPGQISEAFSSGVAPRPQSGTARSAVRGFGINLPALSMDGSLGVGGSGGFTATPGPGMAPLDERSQQMLQVDPRFRAHLQQMGYTISEGGPTGRDF